MKRGIRKGDIVGRKSYGKDILFVVDRIIKTSSRKFCILKGLTVRIEADSPIDDLELIEKSKVEKHIEILDNKLIGRTRGVACGAGRILHLDGDKRYSIKSAKYYKNLGLDAIVKNIPENKRAMQVRSLLERYKPDILVITRS